MIGDRRGHPAVLGIVAALLLASGVLLGAFGSRWLAHERSAAAVHRGPDWSRLTRTDFRIAGAFGALQREGLAASLDALEHAAAADSAVLRGGHQLAHALGREALLGNGGDASIIRQCRPIFASGCYHGVVEASLQMHRQVEMADLEAMCAAEGGENRPGPIVECLHGLGHGVLGAVGFDLQAALRHCDALQRAIFRESCHSGAFMEAINSTFREPSLGGSHGHGGSHSDMAHAVSKGAAAGRLKVDRGDPYSPCDRFEDPYAPTCWMYQGLLILRGQRYNAVKALRICDDAPDGRAGRCYESIGHQLTGVLQRDDEWIVEQCRGGRADLAPHCGAGAAVALVGMDWSGQRAMGFCMTAPAAWKDACYRSAADMVAILGSDTQQAAFCSSIDAKYATACRGVDRGGKPAPRPAGGGVGSPG